MKFYSFRLKPGQDLKFEIEKYVQSQNIQAGFVVTCVAGLKRATLRMAGATPDNQDVRIFDGPLEVNSLVGTISTNGCHLHITVSDREGVSFGGHLKDGSPVHFTAEIVIGEDPTKIFTRERDESTGFDELEIAPVN